MHNLVNKVKFPLVYNIHNVIKIIPNLVKFFPSTNGSNFSSRVGLSKLHYLKVANKLVLSIARGINLYKFRFQYEAMHKNIVTKHYANVT